VTNDLVRRVLEHRRKPPGAFCSRYNVTRLGFVEPADAASIALIESFNPQWEDLAAGWVADASNRVRKESRRVTQRASRRDEFPRGR